MPTMILGPILGFHGREDDRWKISVLAVFDTAPDLAVGTGAAAQTIQPEELWRHQNHTAVIYRWDVSLAEKEQTIAYRVGGVARKFRVPARQSIPRLAYASCNGFSSAPPADKAPYERWAHLLARHRSEGGFHLLLMGGDQVYADSMWGQKGFLSGRSGGVPALTEWMELPRARRLKAKAPRTLRADMDDFYFDLYVSRWSRPEIAEALGSIPTVMMWDDHDIFDGWGSYPEEDQKCDYFRTIFAAAQQAFQVFQLRTKPGTPPVANCSAGEDFSLFLDLGKLAILVLDLRSHRTGSEIMKPAARNAVYERLRVWARAGTGCEHLLVMSSIPVVYTDFGSIEKVLALVPGQQELEDDLKDHWFSHTHQDERKRLIFNLLEAGQTAGCRVTILSGDVHVAALGVIESDRAGTLGGSGTINQLISSAIVHPPPPAVVAFFLQHVLTDTHELQRGLTTRMLEFPGTPSKFVPKRNYLTLTPDDPSRDLGRLWAKWHLEGASAPYTHTIHRT